MSKASIWVGGGRSTSAIATDFRLRRNGGHAADFVDLEQFDIDDVVRV